MKQLYFFLLLIITHFASFGQVTIDFDDNSLWTAGSGSITSYQNDHEYNGQGGIWIFTGGDALRQSSGTQDGEPATASGSYAWRLRNTSTVVWTATYAYTDTLKQIGFKVRRWDDSPSPYYEIAYSTNGGAAYTPIDTIDNAYLSNSSAYTTFSYTLPSPSITAANQFIVRLKALGGTERIMVDDFSYTSSCSPALSTSSESGMSEQCSDGTWTYYGNSGGARKFAIKKNGNTINATVDITVNGGGASYSSTSSNGANQEHASYLMGRYWNVNCTGCTYGMGGGVDVRFYYAPAELTSAESDRDAAFTALPGSSLAVKNTSLEWFKTDGSSFAPTDFTGNNLTKAHIKLTGTTGTQNSINYVEFTGINSFSGGSGGYSFGPPNGGSTNGLPVTWSKHYVDVRNQGFNEIIWQTASEINSSYFIVESSKNGEQFSAISEKILAAGNSSDIKNYSFNDYNISPLQYYRIKQVDIEGSFDFSEILLANRTREVDVDMEINIYPTIIDDGAGKIIFIESNSDNDLNISIVDMQGRIIQEISTNTSSQIDISNIQSGNYFVYLKSRDNNSVKRILIQ